jgi:hypothetical protein
MRLVGETTAGPGGEVVSIAHQLASVARQIRLELGEPAGWVRGRGRRRRRRAGRDHRDLRIDRRPARRSAARGRALARSRCRDERLAGRQCVAGGDRVSALLVIGIAAAAFFAGWLARDLIVTWPRRRRVGEIDTTRIRRPR